jgi:Na+-transporting methylmalonyl-CoA/oxaloacetate decarboxylase gamma subunit
VNDTAIGFLILGLGIVLVLAVVFAVTLRGGGRAAGRATPPKGVHLPAPSALPVVMSVGAALLGAGLSFRPEEPWDVPVLGAISGIAHPILGPLGLVILVLGIWGWVRAANREWIDTEHGSHDTGAH